jgi:glutamate synthase (NADPH/NADH) large chain
MVCIRLTCWSNPRARISVKLVSEVGVGTVAAGVAKAHADVVLISGHDGGTGASPLSSIKHAGAPWELGLAETHQVLVANDLRSRITVEVDGQLKTGRDVVVGALLGAQEFGFATAPLVSLGCVMMRACHLNTCPVGIATQDPVLRARYTGEPEQVETFMRFIAAEVREHLAALGARSLDDVIGHPEHLAPRRGVDHPKARRVDLGRLLHRPRPARHGSLTTQDGGVEASLDARVLLPACAPALDAGRPVHLALPIHNTDRAVGTLVGSEVTRRHGAAGLPEGTIDLRFTGSAGQSFGAFLPRGITLRLAGDANDYLGKGLSGGRIVAAPQDASPFAAEAQVIAGNVACYGATSGEVFLRGMAGERFCVRNSGATAVVEGVGDHGCEYMTGGRVVVLGRAGRNFAAGMSGGIAYVLDADGSFAERCNTDLVGIGPLDDPAEAGLVRELVERHLALTGSAVAARLLGDWAAAQSRFVRVIPHDYRRVVEAEARMLASGMAPAAAQLAAFDEHARHLARAGAR